MIVTEYLIDSVVSRVTGAEFEPGLVTDLRKDFKGLHFTICMDDDICGPEPIRQAQGFNVYLVDGGGHCLSITTEMEAATGLVIAEVEDED